MSTRVNNIVTQIPTLKVGIGGNYYVFCIDKSPLEDICRIINKSINSIYYHNTHNCWVFRVRNKQHKQQLINIGV